MAYQPIIYGVVSSLNSNNVNLALNAVFTGTGENVSAFSNIKVSIFSSHVSAVDGLQIQQSSNNVDWDASDIYTIPATTNKSFSVPVNLTFFRILYANGATATTSFRLQVIFNTQDKQPSSVKPQDARPNDNDFVETLGFLMGYNGTSWDRVRSALKGIQAVNALATQDLKDAGRNQVHYYTLIPVLTTAVDTLQILTGTKGNATILATATPAVVTAGKILRITRVATTYIATAASGYGVVRLRYNTAGVVAITSPISATITVGAPTPATANSVGSEEAALTEGVEFAAGTGIGISVQGFAAVTATAVGYVLVSVTGYEY